MQNSKKRFKRFRLHIPEDVTEYEKILNNSLCTVILRETQLEEIKTYNEEGRLQDIAKNTTFLVHWEEKIL